MKKIYLFCSAGMSTSMLVSKIESAAKDQGIDIIDKKMTIVGAGGAETAIVMQAALDGVKEISIFNIKDASWERALENVEKINSQTQCKAQLFDLNDHETLRKEINESVIFTNATNVGMGKLEGKMVLPDTSYLRKDLIVSDVIYMPEKTKLLEEAEKLAILIENDQEDEIDETSEYATYNFSDFTNEFVSLLRSSGIGDKLGEYIKEHKESFIEKDDENEKRISE